MGSNIVTGGLSGIVGTALLVLAFFIIPGMQKLIFLALWLAPVLVSAAFDFKIGIALWGLLGFWVSLFLTPHISEVLGVPGGARTVSAAEASPSPVRSAEPATWQQSSDYIASLNKAKEDELIGGVMTLREAHDRVCRAHDGQTLKLNAALVE